MAGALDRLAAVEGGRPPSRGRRGVAAGIGTTIVLALAKGKVLLGALKLEKLLVTAWTMFLAIGAYATMYGLPFAAGLVGLVLIHELGHGFAAARVGLPVGAPIFVPFFGAFIALKDRPKSAWQEHVVAAGGPIVGGLASGACVAAALATDGTAAGLLRAVGTTGLILNLFNLTPFWQLDGARMLKAVDARAGVVGVIVAAVALVASAIAGKLNIIALLAVALFSLRVVARLRHRRPADSALDRVAALDQPAPPVEVTVAEGRVAAVVTFVTLSALVVAVQLLAT